MSHAPYRPKPKVARKPPLLIRDLELSVRTCNALDTAGLTQGRPARLLTPARLARLALPPRLQRDIAAGFARARRMAALSPWIRKLVTAAMPHARGHIRLQIALRRPITEALSVEALCVGLTQAMMHDALQRGPTLSDARLARMARHRALRPHFLTGATDRNKRRTRRTSPKVSP